MPTVTEPVRDIRTGLQTGTVTVNVLTQAEADAFTASVATEAANQRTLEQQATDALAANKSFLAITAPTNAQTLAQVKALTRQNNALIRMLLHRLDAVD